MNQPFLPVTASQALDGIRKERARQDAKVRLREEQARAPLVQQQIRHEVCRALVLLGAESDLLGVVGSWGDNLPDEDVLSGLRAWNVATLLELFQRIGHYEDVGKAVGA